MAIRSTSLFKTVLLILTITAFSCNRDNDDNMDVIPNTPVSLVVNLSLPNYFDLTLPGNYMYFADGFRGLILYHAYDGEYYAFDRACSFEPQKPCSQLWMDSSTRVNLYCGEYIGGNYEKCCDSRFEMPSGFPAQGPAVRPLKQYFVSRQGNTLIVSN